MTSLRNALRIGGVAGCSAVVIAGFAVVASCGGNGDGDSNPATTAEAVVGKIEIRGGWIRTTTVDVGAAYFDVRNSGPDDTLTSVTANVGTAAQIHQTVTQGASSMMQEMSGGVDVPANGELKLEPGGDHLMLMGLTSPLKVGDSVELTLQFQNAGTVNIKVPVLADAPTN